MLIVIVSLHSFHLQLHNTQQSPTALFNVLVYNVFYKLFETYEVTQGFHHIMIILIDLSTIQLVSYCLKWCMDNRTFARIYWLR